VFQELVNETASRLSIPAPGVSALMRELLALMTSGRSGGVEGFVDRFRRAGLGNVIASWFGGQQGEPLTSSQIESALGSNTLDMIAASCGLTRAHVVAALIALLPQVIGHLTPTGVLPSTRVLASQVASDIERPTGGLVDQRRLAWVAAVAMAAAALLWLLG